MASNTPGAAPGTPGTDVVAPSREDLGLETRAAPRGPASAVPSITGLRLSPHGGDCVLVNISTTGLLADCGERVQTGSTLTVNFEGGFSPRTVQGKVTRSSVSSMAQGRLRYHVGIAFNKPIHLDELPEQPKAGVPAAESPAPATPTPQVPFNRW